jgi:maleylpyruvate isomerase
MPRDPATERRMTLHGYWRSTTSYRVRIALNLKRIRYGQVTHDLRAGAHRSDPYRRLNPQGLVPALETETNVLVQSPAIIEWLEETYPTPPLLPADGQGRAIVRAMAAVIGCDIHPVNNMRILSRLRTDLDAGDADVAAWIAQWIGDGFGALEAMIAGYGGLYAFGDSPTIADCYLLPQLYSAERFRVDLTAFPYIGAAADRFAALTPVADAHPDRQPDADVA